MSTDSTTKTLILARIEDGVGDFLFYDRKEDDELPRGAIEFALVAGEITIDEMVNKYREELERGTK